jgi:hypothetical protein
MVAGPGVAEIIGEPLNRRMRGAGATIRDDDPGGHTNEDGAEYRRNTFEVIHNELRGVKQACDKSLTA